MRLATLVALLVASWVGAAAHAQIEFDALDLEYPAIGYHANPHTDLAALLNRRLQSGEQQLRFDDTTGYLRSLLAALDIPVESQIAVYSKTSLQQARINPGNPRAIFFNDSTAVAWVPGGFIEVASHDPRQGAILYSLAQTPASTVQMVRDDRCLTCHHSIAAQGVPGFFTRSIPTAVDGTTMPWLGNVVADHRSEMQERWGGWYVTGNSGSAHLGNAVISDGGAKGLGSPMKARNAGAYLSPHSDIVALLVFDHQARMMSLLTRIGWEARVLAHEGRDTASANTLREMAIEVVTTCCSLTRRRSIAYGAPRGLPRHSLLEVRVTGADDPCETWIWSAGCCVIHAAT